MTPQPATTTGQEGAALSGADRHALALAEARRRLAEIMDCGEYGICADNADALTRAVERDIATLERHHDAGADSVHDVGLCAGHGKWAVPHPCADVLPLLDEYAGVRS